jgi:tetratricopeptide (TPR) repeat protein
VPAIRGAIVAADQGGNQMYGIRGRLALARAQMRAGKPQEMQAPLDEVVKMMGQEDADLSSSVEVMRLRAEMLLALQRLDEAERQANEALHRLGYPEKRRGPGLPQVVLTLARVQRAQGRHSQALESARAAAQLFELDTIDPAQSADVGESMLELSQAQLALQDVGAARKSLTRAMQSLRNGLGSDHELTRESERLAGQLHMAIARR